MNKILIYILGIVLSSIGFIYIISYLNLIAIGYNFEEYVKFIYRKPECIIGFIGIFFILISIFYKERRK